MKTKLQKSKQGQCPNIELEFTIDVRKGDWFKVLALPPKASLIVG
jgi:hypothetical protein